MHSDSGTRRYCFQRQEEDEENYVLTDYLKFVKSKRIEIGNPRFWDFIIYKLNKKFPRRCM